MTRERAVRIDKAAADWVAREDARPLDAAERAELQAWLDADSRRFGAYVRMRAVSARMNRLGALAGGAPVRRAAPLWRWSAAAAVVLAIGGGVWLAQPRPQIYQTAVGEMRRLTLADGSVVEINTDSEVKVAYSRHKRRLWLVRGEGNFIVAKDKARPFVVQAGNTTATAVGTAFALKITPDRPVSLTVTEGVVALKPRAETVRYVSAGRQAQVSAGAPQVRAISEDQTRRELAWREGEIILAGETLGDAAIDFNRYNGRKLLVDPSAAGVRVGGVFRTSEVEAFAANAARAFDLRLDHGPGGELRLSSEKTSISR